jgi:LysM repeat protein
MAKAQFKLLLFLMTVGLMLSSMGAVYWYYLRVIRPELRVKSEIAEIKDSKLPAPDPGMRRFEAAVERIRSGDVDGGRDALRNLVQQFPESSACREAKRIISEMNLDRLFSPTDLDGKVEHVVQPGGSLNAIASKHKTSLDMIARMNGLRGSTIHAGDRLLIIPLEFDFVVHAAEKTVTILRQGRFFAEFDAVEVRLPPGFRVPAEMKLTQKSASLDGKPLAPTDPQYLHADKWLPASRPGVVLRPPPAKIDSAADANAAVVQEFGVFLKPEDLEEVFALARSGASLSIVN